MSDKTMDIGMFNEWHGGWGCEGHPPVGYDTREEAEHKKEDVSSYMSGVRGVIEVKVEVVERDGKFWVHNTTTYDRNAQR